MTGKAQQMQGKAEASKARHRSKAGKLAGMPCPPSLASPRPPSCSLKTAPPPHRPPPEQLCSEVIKLPLHDSRLTLDVPQLMLRILKTFLWRAEKGGATGHTEGGHHSSVKQGGGQQGTRGGGAAGV